MNIPKFRAWDKNDKKMRKVESISLLTNFIECELEPSDDPSKYYGAMCVPLAAGEYILTQYTGLKGYMDEAFNDREEKEVARGDVIDIFWEEWPAGYYQENHMIGVVDLDETGTAWIIKNGKYDWDNPTPIPSEIDGMSISRSLPDEEDLEEVFLHNFNLTSADITILGNIHENPELLNEVE